MKEIVMLDMLSGETLLYPIIGDPISFVKSPQCLTKRFEERGHNGICVPLSVPEESLESLILALAPIHNVRGLLITMPHKNAMFEYCATSSETSKLLRVVSIARRNADGSWHGDMLDGAAFVAAQQKEGAELRGARALLVGAGAVGSAIALALLDAGVRELVLHDVNQSRCEELVELLCSLGRGSVVSGTSDPRGCNVIVNATPVGMRPDDPLPVPVHLLTYAMFVGDVVAGHGVTALLLAARNAGCKTSDGFQMVEAGLDRMLAFLQ
jgi:shikimate dehydrogenase